MAQAPLNEQLPVFSMREARFRKSRDANKLVFSLPTHSSLLLQLLRPVCHAYEERDRRWLHLLQAVALVPSRKVDKLRATVRQALKLSVPAHVKRDLEALVSPTLDALEVEDPSGEEDVAARSLLGLQLKEKVAEFLRAWIADPVEGFVLRKEHVVGGMRLDDLVATPMGVGYLRGFRREDGFCVVVYPWGHGFVHLSKVEKTEQALTKALKKRKYNEYVALEHQQLFEQVEGLLENLPPGLEGRADATQAAKGVDVGVDVDVEEYTRLLESLEEEHVDAAPLRNDLSFVRRVQALALKTKAIHQAQSSEEPQLKHQRLHEEAPTPSSADQQLTKDPEQEEKQEEQQELQEGQEEVGEQEEEGGQQS
ncbi:hypothetical protein BBJ28_00004944 [Nothophytophthora sp. Chile5]|nr:hypothetical protein BBJ28_00004944 [Nothophytophthora sp. Chile5]